MENNQDTRMVVFNGVVSGEKKTFTISNDSHISLVQGQAILNRQLIPYNNVERIDVELVKYPFRHPVIKEIRKNGKRRFFSVLKETYYAISDKIGYMQSHLISDLTVIQAKNLIASREETFLVAGEDLFNEYYSRIKR